MTLCTSGQVGFAMVPGVIREIPHWVDDLGANIPNVVRICHDPDGAVRHHAQRLEVVRARLDQARALAHAEE
jgi:hypothetical protein